VTSSWFFLSTLNYDARSTTHQIYKSHIKCYVAIKHGYSYISRLWFTYFCLHVYVKTVKKLLKVKCNSSTSLPDVFCGESWETVKKGFVVRPSLLGSTPTF